MDDRSTTVLRLLAVQTVVVSATIHLIVGLPDLVVSLSSGSFADPRPYLFVPSALLLFGLGTAIVHGLHDRRAYSLSAGVLLTYAVGYVWWHLTDHAGLAPAHEVTDPVGTIVAHLVGDPLALVAFVVEIGGALALLALFVGDPDVSSKGIDPDAQTDTNE